MLILNVSVYYLYSPGYCKSILTPLSVPVLTKGRLVMRPPKSTNIIYSIRHHQCCCTLTAPFDHITMMEK